jgi:hypothetical protein
VDSGEITLDTFETSVQRWGEIKMELDMPAQLIIGGLLSGAAGLFFYLLLEQRRQRRAISALLRLVEERICDLRKADMQMLGLIDTLNSGTRTAFARTGRDIGMLARELGMLEVIDDLRKDRMN